MRWTGMSLTLAALGTLVAGTAAAGHPDVGGLVKGIHKAVQHGGFPGRALERPARDVGRALEHGIRDTGRAQRDVLRSVGGAAGRDLRDLNRGLERLGGPGDYRGDRHDRDAMARAYRDVGIANAVVGLAGIAIGPPRMPAYPPPPPPGQWVREKVVVAPAHYEQYEVWIPEVYDPRTGCRSGGYYETRTRLVPEVCEYRDVYMNYPPPPPPY